MSGFQIEKLKKLEHNHITTILGQHIARTEESELYFLVSSLEQEQTLLDYAVKTDPEYFKEETFGKLFWGVAKGLNYLHGNQIIHCNLNAENVFVQRISGSKQVTMFTKINLKTEKRKSFSQHFCMYYKLKKMFHPLLHLLCTCF